MFASALSKGWKAVGVSIVLLLSLISGPATASSNVKLIKTDRFCLEKALYFSQGVTTDGNYYYSSGSVGKSGIYGLAKLSLDGCEDVIVKLNAIPKSYQDTYGCNHIGGISYYDGKIYAAVENSTHSDPSIMVYNADTLDFIHAYQIPLEDNHMPWCAADADREYLYFSTFDDVTTVYALNIHDMTYSHELSLTQTLHRVQGGEVYNGKIYLSTDNPDSSTEAVYSVNVLTGETLLEFERTVSRIDNEAEGMTVYPLADGSLFHILDYDTIVGVNLRHYSPK